MRGQWPPADRYALNSLDAHAMSESFDPMTMLLALGVIVVIGGFFAYVGYRFWSYGKQLATTLDTRSQRQRERLEYEEKHGAPPVWKRALARLVQALFITVMLGLVWYRLKGL